MQAGGGRGGRAGAPADFVAFVATHEPGLRAACLELTGSARTALALRLDLLAAVALRWRWWGLRRRWWRGGRRWRGGGGRGGRKRWWGGRGRRGRGRWWGGRGRAPSDAGTGDRRPGGGGQGVGRRTELAEHRLSQLLRREAVNWSPSTGATGVIRVVTDTDDETADPVAADAWQRAQRQRATRRLILLAVVVALACAGLVAPRERGSVVLPPSLPGPTLPAGVRVLPRFAELSTLETLSIGLPTTLSVDRTRAAPLAARPVRRVLGLLREELGPLLIVDSDGTRYLDDPALAGARLLTTSLSPDGTRAALAMSNGLLVVDLATGTLHPIPLGTPVPVLVWHTARSVLVPADGAALEVNVDTARSVRIAGVNAADAVTPSGSGLGPLVELTSRSATIGSSARIRVWRVDPGAAAPANPSPTPDANASPTVSRTRLSDVEERPIFGPAWIGRWTGPAWSTVDLLARACSPSGVTLPPEAGVARAAIGVIGANGLYVGTLVTVENTSLDVLGFASPQLVLVAVNASDASVVVAWEPRTGAVRRVTTIDRFARLSLPDLTQV